jgi:hypothetical protein
VAVARRSVPGVRRAVTLALLGAALLPGSASAQVFSQKGFAELRGTAYPQAASNDDTRAVGEFLFRYETTVRPASWLSMTGIADLRADTRDQTVDSWTLDWRDRGTERPRVGIRRLDATVTRGAFSARVGKQFIRWGKADVLNPTDRFAPRDFLNVLDSEFLAVSGARVTVGLQADNVDLIYVPQFTPSRTPLPGQRWAPETDVPAGARLVDAGRERPGGAQYGARWNHVGGGFEFSLSGYRGYSHTPSVQVLPAIQIYPPVIALRQFYPQQWMAGGDAAWPLSWFTVKAEAAFFGTDDARADQYWLYVIQIERQAGEWFFVGGYAGEAVTTARQDVSFAPERGLTKAFLGRAGYTIDTNRSVAMEGAVRQTLEGWWLRGEYSQASGQHLRLTIQGSWIGGDPDDFFGRYRRNSNLTATLRYSF